MRLHPRPMLAVIALCMAGPACHATGDTPAAAPDASAASAPSTEKTSVRHHWRHWSHYRHGSRAGGPDFGHTRRSDFGGGGMRSGHGHSLRWHTVRDRHGNRHKEWYYADTGESASGPDGDSEPARDLEAPLSRREAADLHERRLKALDHLAAVEQRVERDRRQRAVNAKAHFHRIFAKDAAKARAAKK